MNGLELVLEEHFPNIKDFDKWGLEGDEYSLVTTLLVN